LKTFALFFAHQVSCRRKIFGLRTLPLSSPILKPFALTSLPLRSTSFESNFVVSVEKLFGTRPFSFLPAL